MFKIKPNLRWHFSTCCVYNFFHTLCHKWYVFKYLSKIAIELVLRGLKHDLSKFGPHEFFHFSTGVVKLGGLEFGSPEYKVECDKIRPALDHHYQWNSHHPQHYKNKYRDMSAIDKIEMCADWAASVLRTKNGNFTKSIAINQKKFSINKYDIRWIEDLGKFLENK